MAAGDVAKATPDGQTLLAAASSLAANPTLVKALPYDTLKDLQAVALIFRTPLVLVVDPKLPVHTVAELVALLKAKPGQINFGHGGPGSAIHLAGELFQVMTGTEMIGVSYRGAPLALDDVMAGHVALMFADAGSVMGQINAGTVRPLGVSSTIRVPALPDGADARRSRRARLRRGRLDLDLRAGGDAEADRRAAQRRAQEGRRHARGAVAHDQARHHSGAKSRARRLEKFLAAEIDRWGDLIKRAGVANTL